MAQTQLNQIVALEKGVKSRAQADFVAAGQQLQKTALLSGISRTYKPKDDEGEQLPPESTRVQVRARDVLGDVQQALTRLFDVILTKDVANTPVPGGQVIWLLTLVNGGTLTAPGPLTIADTLPDGVTYVRAGGPGWSCGASGADVTCTSAGPLQPGASSGVELTAEVTAAPGTSLTNVAVASSPLDDAVPADNTDDALTVVSAVEAVAGASDVGAPGAEQPSGLPVTGWWAGSALRLALSLVTVGALVLGANLRRRGR